MWIVELVFLWICVLLVRLSFDMWVCVVNGMIMVLFGVVIWMFCVVVSLMIEVFFGVGFVRDDNVVMCSSLFVLIFGRVSILCVWWLLYVMVFVLLSSRVVMLFVVLIV